MTLGTPSVSYAALRKMGHSMECAYEIAFKNADCSCESESVERQAVVRERGRPRLYATNAERQAAYCRRKFEV